MASPVGTFELKDAVKRALLALEASKKLTYTHSMQTSSNPDFRQSTSTVLSVVHFDEMKRERYVIQTRSKKSDKLQTAFYTFQYHFTKKSNDTTQI